MTQTKKAPGGTGTFLRFAWQQLRDRTHLRSTFHARPIDKIAAQLRAMSPQTSAPEVAELTLSAKDTGWRATGIDLQKGQNFTVFAHGVIWISKALSVGALPATALWLRIGGRGPLRKMMQETSSFDAWSDGALELCLKPPGEWANENGDFDRSVPRSGATGAIDAVVAVWREEDQRGLDARPDNMPVGWSYLWRIGDGSIYQNWELSGKNFIHVHTHGDVGILQYPIEAPLDDTTTLDWRWLIDKLPSVLPEHIQPTHDYLSIAVEFENGQDLTYFWSSELPIDTVFKCPLPWWDKRETHWVVRSGRDGLGQWQSEHRSLRSDYAQAIGGTMPSKVVRIWLIANSVFQRQHGEAKFADIILTASGAAQRIV
jgi:hypothetical protein